MYVILSTLVYSAVQYTAFYVEGALVWRPQVLKDNIHFYKINNPMNKQEFNVWYIHETIKKICKKTTLILAI